MISRSEAVITRLVLSGGFFLWLFMAHASSQGSPGQWQLRGRIEGRCAGLGGGRGLHLKPVSCSPVAPGPLFPCRSGRWRPDKPPPRSRAPQRAPRTDQALVPLPSLCLHPTVRAEPGRPVTRPRADTRAAPLRKRLPGPLQWPFAPLGSSLLFLFLRRIFFSFPSPGLGGRPPPWQGLGPCLLEERPS